MDILRLRAAAGHSDACLDELLASDEMVELMAPDDRQEVKQELSRHASQRRERGENAREWHAAKRKVVHAAVARATAEAKAVAKAAGRRRAPAAKASAAPDWRAPREWPRDVVAQADAKRLLPPGAYIWHCNKSYAWAGHLLGNEGLPSMGALWQPYASPALGDPRVVAPVPFRGRPHRGRLPDPRLVLSEPVASRAAGC